MQIYFRISSRSLFILPLIVSFASQFFCQNCMPLEICYSRKYHCDSHGSRLSRGKVTMLFSFRLSFPVLFCLSCLVQPVPFCVFRSSCPAIPVLFCVSHLAWPVLSVPPVMAVLAVHVLGVLSWQSCFIILVMADLVWQSCPAGHLLPARFAYLFCLSCSTYSVLSVHFCLSYSAWSVLPVRFRLSRTACPILSCPVLPALFCLSCTVCPIPDVPFWLHSNSPFWLSCPGCRVLTVHFWLSCPSYYGCSFLAVLSSCPVVAVLF